MTLELNGMTREASIDDRSVATKTKPRLKADLADRAHVAAPIPGLIATVSASVGAKVAEGKGMSVTFVGVFLTLFFGNTSENAAEEQNPNDPSRRLH